MPSRKAGETGALDKFDKFGGKKNSAFGGNVSTYAPGASALKKKETSSAPRAQTEGKPPVKKESTEQFSKQYGASKDYFGHKDYYAARAGGASNEDILKQLDNNSQTLRGGNVKGGGGLYDQIKSGYVPGWDDKQGGGASNTKNSYNTNNTNRTTANTKGAGSGNKSTRVNAGDKVSGLNNNSGEINFDNSRTIDASVTDNSINITEGSRNFTYQGGSGQGRYEDAPMSAYTMAQLHGGYDSAASNAKFVAGFDALNKNRQAANPGGGHAYNLINKNKEVTEDPDPNNIANSAPFYMKDEATIKNQQTFGDSGRWKMPKPPTFNVSKIMQDNFSNIGSKDKDDD